MQIINNPAEIASGLCALVPTMGNLHPGHLSLIRRAKQTGLPVAASIFVNPMQFSAGEDYDKYPRTLENDIALLHNENTDFVFAPKVKDMYQPNLDNVAKVIVPGISDELCGKFRPGHFTGVTTVVAKLFNMFRPKVAVFGEKDFQQLFIIKRMVRELDFAVEIISSPIVREEDGLAMSSRNRYLTGDERKKAPLLFKMLLEARSKLLNGVNPNTIKREGINFLQASGFIPGYLSIRDINDFTESNRKDNVIILTSARLGSTNLIDNIIVRAKNHEFKSKTCATEIGRH